MNITVPLTIEQISLAYDAINQTPAFEHTAMDILEILDVPEFREMYNLEFTIPQFEQIRIAIKFDISPIAISLSHQLNIIRSEILTHQQSSSLPNEN